MKENNNKNINENSSLLSHSHSHSQNNHNNSFSSSSFSFSSSSSSSFLNSFLLIKESFYQFIETFYEISLNYIQQYKIIIMIILSICFGSLFYSYENNWPLSTSIFYTINTLLGELFMIPGNKTPLADVFTVLLYIYGAFFLAGILGQYVGVLVARASEIAAGERRKLMECPDNPIDMDEDGYVGFLDYLSFFKIKIMHRIGWENNKWKYITFGFVIIWIGVGILYGMIMESKTFGSALFFALSTIAGACYVGPECDNGDDMDCDIGMIREILVTIYVLIGYPLFTILLGQFASLFIEHTVREHEKQILKSPLSEEEYRYAANLYGDDELISLGEFTILELLRLQRVTVEDLDRIREIFNQVDVGSTGNLTKPMLAKSNLYRGYGSFDEVDLLKKEPEIEPEQREELFHYLTENDRANSLPPEITTEMYQAIVGPRLFLDTDYAENPPPPPPLSQLDSSITESPKKRKTSLRGSVTSGGISKGDENEEKTGIERMTIRKYNEVVIPLAVSSVIDGIDFCDADAVADLYGEGDY